jgi:2-polyprenyl-3-methyl-5-hydroxy-6-metoxy-1,4-benzoquinol methylase
MKNINIDHGKEFNWGKTSLDYSKYRDIYPESIYINLYNRGIGIKNQAILDLGTGTGVFPRAMYKYGAEYIGIDISEEQIKYAKELSKEQNMNIEYKACSAESTGFETNKFGVITAVQCFIYFDKKIVIPEIARMLKKDGKFIIIWMTWLPHEDKIAEETEKIILKYNPQWTGAGYRRTENNEIPEWAKENFELLENKIYTEKIKFNYETWTGRIRACRGVSAALPENMVKIFNEEHILKLKELTKEPFEILHEIKIITFQKNNWL